MNVEIYTKNDCNYCTLIKNLFDHHGIRYTVLNVSIGEATKEEIQERAGPEVKINTVPQVFLDDKYLGGYIQVLEYLAYDRHITG